MKIITMKEAEYISFRLAKEELSFNEPIPDFSTRFPSILESSLSVPFQSFAGRSLYPTLIGKASMLKNEAVKSIEKFLKLNVTDLVD